METQPPPHSLARWPINPEGGRETEIGNRSDLEREKNINSQQDDIFRNIGNERGKCTARSGLLIFVYFQVAGGNLPPNLLTFVRPLATVTAVRRFLERSPGAPTGAAEGRRKCRRCHSSGVLTFAFRNGKAKILYSRAIAGASTYNSARHTFSPISGKNSRRKMRRHIHKTLQREIDLRSGGLPAIQFGGRSRSLRLRSGRGHARGEFSWSRQSRLWDFHGVCSTWARGFVMTSHDSSLPTRTRFQN